MSIFTPVNQIRLTNVAVVRLKRGGKRFELACYPNKVGSWREHIEKDLDEVLQISRVFENVSKGAVAKNTDLEKCFGTTDEKKIIRMILEKGDLQVSAKERQQKKEETFRDIATIVADKCVNPTTGRALTLAMVERAMKDEIHYSVTGKNAKKQALDVIRLLQEKGSFPIARAHMRLLITLPAGQSEHIKQQLLPMLDKVERSTEEGSMHTMTCLIEPGEFRGVEEVINNASKKASVEVVDLSVMEQETTVQEVGAASTAGGDEEEPGEEASAGGGRGGRKAKKRRRRAKGGGRGGGGGNDDDDDDDDDDDSSEASSSSRGGGRGRGGGGGGGKGRKKKKKGRRGFDDDSDDEPRGGRRRGQRDLLPGEDM